MYLEMQILSVLFENKTFSDVQTRNVTYLNPKLTINNKSSHEYHTKIT